VAILITFFGGVVLSENLAFAFRAITIYFLGSGFMLYNLFPLSFSSLPRHNKARLSLRTVLVGLNLICIDQTQTGRSKLVKKYIKWFKEGLSSYNSFLYKFKPAHIEIVDIDRYYCSICSVSLIGNPAERDIAKEQIRCILDSIGGRIREEDFRQLLTSLKNLKNVERRDNYRLSELNKLVRILSFSDRVKQKLKSPYLVIILGIIPVIASIIQLIPTIKSIL
jgi:hypothetical protein